MKEQGNALVAERDYSAAVAKYAAAMSSGGRCKIGDEVPLRLNRALCYLKLAAVKKGGLYARAELYDRASADATAMMPFALGGMQAKARFRLAQALYGCAIDNLSRTSRQVLL